VENRFQRLPFKCNLQRYNGVAEGNWGANVPVLVFFAMTAYAQTLLGGALQVESS
jgi:hypothetical protein